jgi:hypothetical protein
LFYVDSNGVTPITSETPLFQLLQAAHPDCLFIPEHSNFCYYPFTSPYTDLGSSVQTNTTVQEAYPGAFSVIVAAHGNAAQSVAGMTQGVQRGDIYMFQSWWHGPDFGPVQTSYQQGTANGGPKANSECFQVPPGKTVQLNVLANDFDVVYGRQPLQIVSFTQPNAGKIALPFGNLYYQAPAEPWPVPVTFSYTISDGVKTDSVTDQIFVTN